MLGKHITKKVLKIVVPMIVAVTCLGGTINCLAAETMYLSDEPVIIETTVYDEGELADEVVTDGALYQRTDFQTLRNGLEVLFETSKGAFGNKFGSLYMDKSGENNSPSYFQALSTAEVNRLYNERKDKIAVLASKSFNDVKGNEWFSSNIPLAVYYGVINGYEDGSFRAENHVTVAEMAKMIASATEGIELAVDDTYLEYIGSNSSCWFNGFFTTVGRVMPYNYSTDVTLDYMNSAMTRGEVAYSLARVLDNGRGELDGYIEKANNGDVGGYFNDLSIENVAPSEGTLGNETWLIDQSKIPGRFAGSIMFMKDKGIMFGDEFGNCNALSGVTRAEAVALLERVALSGVNYNKGEFSVVNKTVEVTKPSSAKVYKYSPDTVVNPDAEAKYQYTVGDLSTGYGDDLLLGKTPFNEGVVSPYIAKGIVDEVTDSVTFENGILRLNIPDIKSDYHEISIRGDFDYTYQDSIVKRWHSSEETGSVEINLGNVDEKAKLDIRLVGRHDLKKSAVAYYMVQVDLLTG